MRQLSCLYKMYLGGNYWQIVSCLSCIRLKFCLNWFSQEMKDVYFLPVWERQVLTKDYNDYQCFHLSSQVMSESGTIIAYHQNINSNIALVLV